MSTTIGLFGQPIYDPICGDQLPLVLVHEPVAPAPVKLPDETPADRAIAKQYDPAQTPLLPLKIRKPKRSVIRCTLS